MEGTVESVTRSYMIETDKKIVERRYILMVILQMHEIYERAYACTASKQYYPSLRRVRNPQLAFRHCDDGNITPVHLLLDPPLTRIFVFIVVVMSFGRKDVILVRG